MDIIPAIRELCKGDKGLTSTTEYVIGGMKYKVNSIFDIETKDIEEALKRLMEKEIDKVS